MDIRIRALGPLAVEVDGREVPLGGAQAERILNVLLANVNDPCSLDRMLEECWGQTPPPSARNTLQSYVSRLRKLLGGNDRIRRIGDHYQLTLDPTEFDVLEFEVGHAEVAAVALDSDVSHLSRRCRRLLTLWHGPPFGAGEHPPCVVQKVIQLEEFRVEVAEAAIEEELDSGGAGASVLVEIQSLMERHPWRESLPRLLAIALYSGGRQTEALRELAGFRRRLADEAGLVASELISDTEQAILEHRPLLGIGRSATASPLRPSGDGGLPDGLSQLAAQALVGRVDDLEMLRRAVTRDKRVPFVCVSGEPGIGKSRLAAALAVECWASGWVILYGRCGEILDLPFQPISQALTGLGLKLSDHEVSSLGPLVSSAATTSESAPPFRDIESAWSQLFDAATRLIARLARHDKVLLVVDDLQWASRPTLALLDHLVSVGTPDQLCVVATMRDTDVDPASPSVAMVDGLDRRGRATTMRLEGLRLAEIHAWAQRDAADGRRTAEELWAASAGNPLLLMQLIDDDESRTGSEDFGTSPSDDLATVATRSVPATVANFVERRLVTIGLGAAGLRTAALIGLEFEDDVLAAAIGEDPLNLLERAGRAGLVIELGPGRWMFRHGLVRDALEAGLGETRRRRTHQSVADAIVQRFGEIDPTVFGRIARHSCAGADRETASRAVERAVRAAKHRLDQLSPPEALTHITDARDVVDNVADIEAPLEVELFLTAAEIQLWSFDEPERIAACDLAVAAARRADSPELLARAAAARTRYWPQGDIDHDAVAMVREALDGLGPGFDDLRSRLLASLAFMTGVTGRILVDAAPTDVIRTAERSVELARKGGDRDTLLVACNSIVVALLTGPHAQRQIDVAESFRRPRDPISQLVAAHWSASPRLILGDRPGFRACVDSLIADGQALQRPKNRAYGLQCAAMDAMLDGNFDRARELASDAVRVGNEHPNYTRVRDSQLFWCAYEERNLADLLPFLELAVAENPTVPAFRAMYAVALIQLGRTDAAAFEIALVSHDEFADIPRDILWTGVMCGACEVATVLGDRAIAATLRGLLEPYAGQLCVIAGGGFVYGAIDRFRAMAAHACGDMAEAKELFDSATRLERHVNAPILVDRTRSWAERLGFQPMITPSPGV